MTPVQRLGLQSRLLAATHSFFKVRNIQEIITPCIVSSAHSEPGIESFDIDSGLYQLRSSPEYEMKRLLMKVESDIYQIAPVFRKGEHGTRHRPEFIMLEWYRIDWNYRRLMEECLDYLQTMIAHSDIKTSRLSYQQLFEDNLGCNPFACNTESLITQASDLGYESAPTSRAECLDFLFEYASTKHSIVNQPHTLLAVYDFPLEQASFARISSRCVAERFEIFLNGIELANGYGELTRAEDYYERVRLHEQTRKMQAPIPISIDEDFMHALKRYGLAECAGVSVGIERLLMCKARVADIAQIRLL